MTEDDTSRFSYMFDARSDKPRESGITFVIGDTVTLGGINALTDIVEFAGAWIDWYKFVYSSIPFQPTQLLQDKLELLERHDIQAFPGGNFLEAAVYEGVEDRFLDDICDIGCDRIEVSTTVVEMSPEEKATLIANASERGFHVHSEVGKKPSEGSTMRSLDQMIEEMRSDLEAGADKVIFESEVVEELLDGNQPGEGSRSDAVTEIERIIDAVGFEAIVFELPLISDYHLTKTSAWFINQFGADINLGNVIPTHVNLIEQQRRGIGPYTVSASSAHEE